MVRLGMDCTVSNDAEEQLENVGTLKSIISQIRTISAGESVGYGRRFVIINQLQLQFIGYADGISRSWGNGVGHVMIKIIKHKLLAAFVWIC
jgi:alanine racemase